MTDMTVTDDKVDTAASEQSLMDEMGAIFDAANARDDEEAIAPANEDARETEDAVTEQSRGPDGKFAAKEAAESAPADTEISDQSVEQESEPETVLAAPASWSPAAKAAWPTLGPVLQQEMLKREADWQRADGERTTRIKGYEPIEQALAPIRQTLDMQGVQPATYVSQLVSADRMLRDPATRAQAYAQIAQMYGIEPSAGAEPAYADPALTPLVSKIDALEGYIRQQAQAQEQADQTRLDAEITAFAVDHPYFEEVRADMGRLIDAGMAADLQSAYDKAVRANDTTFAKLQAERAAAEDAKRKTETAQKAATARRIGQTNLSSKGTAGGQTPAAYASIEEEMSAIYDQVAGTA